MSNEALLEEENRSLKLRIQELETAIIASRSNPPSTNGKVEAGSSRNAIDKKNGEEPKGGRQHSDGGNGENGEEETSDERDGGKGEIRLCLEEYRRYGRQMIMPEIGFNGQLRLKGSKVLVVGVGGLGSPAAAYIVGAGVGTVGIVDHDVVEESNLHRQIIHSSSRVRVSKVESAMTFLRDLNPHTQLIPHACALSPTNVLSILAPYDLILDCTDHPTLRYLISDAAVLLSKPVVSASALRTDGQLIVLNSPPGHGPCYRCIWPRPPPPETVVGCGEGGILGPVVGVMGVLQALEAIKVLASPPAADAEGVKTSMTIFSAYASPPFRTVKMRGQRKGCVACGFPPDGKGKVTRESVEGGGTDYVAFCGMAATSKGLKAGERVGVEEYRKVREGGARHLLVDVRDRTQFGICRLEGSYNIPYSEFQELKHLFSSSSSPSERIPQTLRSLLTDPTTEEVPVYVLCRLGNDSQLVVKQLKDAGIRNVFDICGGITEWARKSDGSFPEY